MCFSGGREDEAPPPVCGRPWCLLTNKPTCTSRRRRAHTAGEFTERRCSVVLSKERRRNYCKPSCKSLCYEASSGGDGVWDDDTPSRPRSSRLRRLQPPFAPVHHNIWWDVYCKGTVAVTQQKTPLLLNPTPTAEKTQTTDAEIQDHFIWSEDLRVPEGTRGSRRSETTVGARPQARAGLHTCSC